MLLALVTDISNLRPNRAFARRYFHPCEHLFSPLPGNLTSSTIESLDMFLTCAWQECGLDPATGFPTPFYQPDSIIVATAGAYKHQRFCYPGPRAGYAVFFGPRNEMNVYGGSVPKVRGHWMSVDRGECTAAAAALDSVLQMLERNRGLLPSGRKLRSVIIKTASEYMAKTVTDR